MSDSWTDGVGPPGLSSNATDPGDSSVKPPNRQQPHGAVRQGDALFLWKCRRGSGWAALTVVMRSRRLPPMRKPHDDLLAGNEPVTLILEWSSSSSRRLRQYQSHLLV